MPTAYQKLKSEKPKHPKKPEARMNQNNDSGREENGRPYDLEERTALFGEEIIRFSKKISVSSVTNRLIDQLVGAGTSVGANYCEADDAVSKKDFRHKISISKREARESKFFLRMIATAVPELKEEAKVLWQEAKELHLIFAKIYRG
jgi:four helix bundle protein